MRWKLTLRGDAPQRTEIRGYADWPMEKLEAFSEAMKPFALVIASPAEDDYDPFERSKWDKMGAFKGFPEEPESS